ncbi:MAG: sugar phosphate isomerase/epimerase family protein [Thermoplasmata archaeon]
MMGFSCPPMCMMPFREAAELVLPHFGHWEVVSEAHHFLPDIESDIREVMETTGIGMSVHAPFSDINIGAFDERTRRYAVGTLCEVIRTSSRLGIGTVTIHPGVIGPIQRYDRERVFKLTRKSLEEICAEAGDLGVGIALENMPAMKVTICQTAAEMERMLEGLEMGMCLDIGHAHISGQIDEMLGLEKRFLNIHVHDNIGGPSDQHLALGKGKIDFSVLGRLHYTGNHIIEANNADMDEAAASKRFLENALR